MGAAATLNVPQNLEAERATLGSLLIDPQAISDVEPILAPGDFYLRKHRLIWEAMLAVKDRRDPLDFLTLSTELKDREQTKAAGGEAYLAGLISEVPSAINVVAYARKVRELSVRRRILEDLSTTSRDAYDLDLPLSEVIERLRSRALALSGSLPAERLRSLRQVVAAVYDELDAAAGDHQGPVLVSTGYLGLDRYLGGWRPGSLNLVGARTGDGKTALLTNFATRAAKAGKSVLVFALEMTAESLAERLLVGESGVSLVRLSAKNPRDDEWPALSEAMGVLGELSVWVDDTPSITIPDLIARVQRFMMSQPLDLILVDYLQLARLGRRVDKRYLEVGLVAQELKRLAREVNLPIVAAAQLSRGVAHRADKRPMLSDLRESGNLEQDSDAVLLIHHIDDSASQRQVVDLIVAKNRFGPTGTVALLWQGAKVAFVEPGGRGEELGS